MSFTFQCTHCNFLLEAEDNQEGLVCNCPNCQRPVMVRHMTASSPESSPTEAAPPKRIKSRYVFARLYCRLVRIIALLVVLSGIYWIYDIYTATHKGLDQYQSQIKQAAERYTIAKDELASRYASTIQALTQPFTPTDFQQINSIKRRLEAAGQTDAACKNGLTLTPELTRFPDAFPEFLETPDEVKRAKEAIKTVGNNIETMKEQLKAAIFHYTPSASTQENPAPKLLKRKKNSSIKVLTGNTMDLFTSPENVKQYWNQLTAYALYALKQNNTLSSLTIADIKNFNTFLQWENYIVSNLIGKQHSTLLMNTQDDDDDISAPQTSTRKRVEKSTKEKLAEIIAEKILGAPWHWKIDPIIESFDENCRKIELLIDSYETAKSEARNQFIKETILCLLKLLAISFALLIISDIITAHLDTADNSWK